MICEVCAEAADNLSPHSAIDCDNPITCTCSHLPYGSRVDRLVKIEEKINGQGSTVGRDETAESAS